MEKKRALIIETSRTGHGPNEVAVTMCIGELMDTMQELAYALGYDAKVYLSFDGGRTYGGITEDAMFYAEYDEHGVVCYEDGCDVAMRNGGEEMEW